MQKQRWYIADNGVYSKLITVMGKKGQTRMAMWLFSEMRNGGCRPDVSVYNTMRTVWWALAMLLTQAIVTVNNVLYRMTLNLTFNAGIHGVLQIPGCH